MAAQSQGEADLLEIHESEFSAVTAGLWENGGPQEKCCRFRRSRKRLGGGGQNGCRGAPGGTANSAEISRGLLWFRCTGPLQILPDL